MLLKEATQIRRIRKTTNSCNLFYRQIQFIQLDFDLNGQLFINQLLRRFSFRILHGYLIQITGGNTEPVCIKPDLMFSQSMFVNQMHKAVKTIIACEYTNELLIHMYPVLY